MVFKFCILIFSGHPINFRGIKSNLGTFTDLEAFIKAANSRGQHVVLELDPSHSSVEHPWFKSSVNRDGNFTNYYVWADPKMENGVRSPPNNWVIRELIRRKLE